MATFEKPIVKDFNYLNMIGTSRLVGEDRLKVLKMLLKWRDYIARVQDESRAYVLPNHVLLEIARILPKTQNDLKDCMRSSSTPLAIQKHSKELLEMISDKLNPSRDKPKLSERPKAELKVSKQKSDETEEKKGTVKSKYSYLSGFF